MWLKTLMKKKHEGQKPTLAIMSKKPRTQQKYISKPLLKCNQPWWLGGRAFASYIA